jgi:hypothetical protein
MRWTGHVPRQGKNKNMYKSFVSQREWKRPFRGLRSRMEDNTREYTERVA